MDKQRSQKILTQILIVGFICIMCTVFVSCGSGSDSDPSKDQADPTAEDTGAFGTFQKIARKTSRKIARAVNRIFPKPISRKKVYRLKNGTRLTKKTIKKNGGRSRYFRIYKIKKGDRVYKKIYGKSFKSNSAVSLSELRYIKTLHYDFDGKIRTGEIIVNQSIARDTMEVFRELYDAKYQIRKMRLVDNYYMDDGSGIEADARSMNDDNTSGFNYRTVVGTNTISMHGYGRAIDVNPFENPWCPGGVLHSNQQKSAEYANRGINTGVRKPHMIFLDSEITGIFKKHGFRWLGETGTRDYQHFEK